MLNYSSVVVKYHFFYEFNKLLGTAKFSTKFLDNHYLRGLNLFALSFLIKCVQLRELDLKIRLGELYVRFNPNSLLNLIETCFTSFSAILKLSEYPTDTSGHAFIHRWDNFNGHCNRTAFKLNHNFNVRDRVFYT